MTELVILHAGPLQGKVARDFHPREQFSVLNLDGRGHSLEAFLAAQASRGVSAPSVLKVGDLAKEAATNAGKKYRDFIAEWPQRYRRSGKNFRELFTYRGKLSLWWLSSAKMKDPERGIPFTWLFHLELVSLICRGGTFSQVHLFSDDPVFRDLLQQWGQKHGVAVTLHPRRPGRRVALRWSLPGRVLSRLKAGASLMLSFLMVRALGMMPLPREGGDSRPEVIFYSWLGASLLVDQTGLRERFYVDLPRYLEANTVFRPRYASHVYPQWRYLFRKRAELRAHRDELIFLEGYLGLGDILAFLMDWRLALAYLWRAKLDPKFRASFEYDGLNIYRLVQADLEDSFVGPHLQIQLLVVKAIERLASRRRPSHIINFMELHPQGLAVYAGAKLGYPEVITVAYQQSIITRMKLWYFNAPHELGPPEAGWRWVNTMPLPDRCLFQGSLGLEVLQESGYPASRSYLTGSPRYEWLATRAKPDLTPKHRAALGIAAGAKIVLVPTLYSLEESRYLVRTVAQACAGNHGWVVVFKPHPAHPSDTIVAAAAGYSGSLSYVVCNDPVDQLIRMADVLVTTYSTAADEAIAVGCPVIIVKPDSSFTLGTNWEIEFAPTASDAAELRGWLNTLFEHPEGFARFRQTWPQLIEASFYRLDGHAKERVAQVLLGQDKSVDQEQGAARPIAVGPAQEGRP